MKSSITTPVFESLNITDKKNAVCITDENVFSNHSKFFKNINTIVLKAGEEFKTQETINAIAEQLIDFGVDKSTKIYGIGGGVVTDIAGFAASVYMRGLQFALVPTTLLAMVDASIGGKNGVNFGLQKNFIGTINQPNSIIIDTNFLETLSDNEWQNGFAEIIKHSCIKDAVMFKELMKNNLSLYQKDKKKLSSLIKQNIAIKLKVVAKDVNEKGERKLLNFGHTLGHALEIQYELSHGQAIAIGMCFASKISEEKNNFKEVIIVKELLNKYGLPTDATYNKQKIFNILKMDKKKDKTNINFVLLERIGKATLQSISIEELKTLL